MCLWSSSLVGRYAPRKMWWSPMKNFLFELVLWSCLLLVLPPASVIVIRSNGCTWTDDLILWERSDQLQSVTIEDGPHFGLSSNRHGKELASSSVMVGDEKEECWGVEFLFCMENAENQILRTEFSSYIDSNPSIHPPSQPASQQSIESSEQPPPSSTSLSIRSAGDVGWWRLTTFRWRWADGRTNQRERNRQRTDG